MPRAVRDRDERGRLESEAVEDLLAPFAEARAVRRHAPAAAFPGLPDRVGCVDAERAREWSQPRQRKRIDDIATLQREERRRTLRPGDENMGRPERRLDPTRLGRERQSRKRQVVERLDCSARRVGLVDRIWLQPSPPAAIVPRRRDPSVLDVVTTTCMMCPDGPRRDGRPGRHGSQGRTQRPWRHRKRVPSRSRRRTDRRPRHPTSR